MPCSARNLWLQVPYPVPVGREGGKVSHKAKADTDGWEGTDYNLKSMFVYVCGKKVQNLFISGVEFIVVRLLLSL